MVTEAIKAVNIDHDLSDRVKTSYSQQMTRAKAFAEEVSAGVVDNNLYQAAESSRASSQTAPIERRPQRRNADILVFLAKEVTYRLHRLMRMIHRNLQKKVQYCGKTRWPF